MGFGVVHNKSVTVADWSGVVTVGNSSGGTTTMQASDLARPSDWNSLHKLNVNTCFYEPFPPAQSNSSFSTRGIGTWYLEPFFVPHGLDSGQINILMGEAAGFLHGTTISQQSSGSITRYQTMEHILALYKQDSGANSTRLTTVWSSNFQILATWERRFGTAGNTLTMSNYLTLSFPSQYDASGGVTYGTTSQSGTRSTSTTTTSGTYASSFGDSLITGAVARISGSKFMPFGLNVSLAPDDYWLGVMQTSTSSSTGTGNSQGTMLQAHSKLFHMDPAVMNQFKLFGQSVSNTSSIAQGGFFGFVATTSSRPITSLATSDMRGQTTTGHGRIYWNYQKTTY